MKMSLFADFLQRLEALVVAGRKPCCPGLVEGSTGEWLIRFPTHIRLFFFSVSSFPSTRQSKTLTVRCKTVCSYKAKAQQQDWGSFPSDSSSTSYHSIYNIVANTRHSTRYCSLTSFDKQHRQRQCSI